MLPESSSGLIVSPLTNLHRQPEQPLAPPPPLIAHRAHQAPGQGCGPMWSRPAPSPLPGALPTKVARGRSSSRPPPTSPGAHHYDALLLTPGEGGGPVPFIVPSPRRGNLLRGATGVRGSVDHERNCERTCRRLFTHYYMIYIHCDIKYIRPIYVKIFRSVFDGQSIWVQSIVLVGILFIWRSRFSWEPRTPGRSEKKQKGRNPIQATNRGRNELKQNHLKENRWGKKRRTKKTQGATLQGGNDFEAVLETGEK